MGEHRTFIFSISFLLMFFLLISQVPSMLISNQAVSTYVSNPPIWQTNRVGLGAVVNSSQRSVTYPVGGANWWNGVPFYIHTDDDYTIYFNWYGSITNQYLVLFVADVYGVHIGENMLPFPITLAYAKLNNATNSLGQTISEFTITSTTGGLILLMEISNSTNGDLNYVGGWNSGRLLVRLVYAPILTQDQAQTNIWNVIAAILTFRLPTLALFGGSNLFIMMVDVMISTVVWISITVCILYIWGKIKPFG